MTEHNSVGASGAAIRLAREEAITSNINFACDGLFAGKPRSYKDCSVSAVVVGRFLRRIPGGYATLRQRLQLLQNPLACALWGPSVTSFASLISSDRV